MNRSHHVTHSILVHHEVVASVRISTVAGVVNPKPLD